MQSFQQHSPAADRNKQPILQKLRELLPEVGAALEIASGTGQHVAWFAQRMPQWTWQPTDLAPGALPSIAAWCADAHAANALPPLQVDVMAQRWPASGPEFAAKSFDAIYCANMLHIAPWATCAALMGGVARYLAPRGLLVLYGPFLDAGAPAPSNLAFDQNLRERNPEWGLRRLADVVGEAGVQGLALQEKFSMPANNLLLAFARDDPLADA